MNTAPDNSIQNTDGQSNDDQNKDGQNSDSQKANQTTRVGVQQPTDWQQREQGRDLAHSYIVQAPAGSGKTELLTQRLLALLSRVENPEEVVAITFTRKAAAEMSHRLIGRLQAAALSKSNGEDASSLQPHEQVSRHLALAVLDNDARHNWNLLEQPGRLRIRTIDGLGSELARQLPVLSGLGSGHQIATDADALYRLAATRTMSVIEKLSDPLHADVTRVLDRYDNGYDKLVNLLTSMLANREQWLPHLMSVRHGEDFDRKGLEQALNLLVVNQLQDARDATPDELLQSMPAFYRYAIANQANNKEDLLALLNACGGEDCDFLDLPVEAESLPVWCTFVESLFTKAGDMRKSAPNANDGYPAPSTSKDKTEKANRKQWKDDLSAVFDIHRGNEELRKFATIIRALPAPHYEDEAWDALQSLMRILLRAAIELVKVMATSGEVDFGEIAYRAIQALGSEEAPSELALRMDYRIQHLLVDEFQDTSSSQIRLLRQLTSGWSDGDGRTLFLVGDPMQSIYRFRKAEVSLFIKAWEGDLFNHVQLIPLQLTVNFRSTQPVVDWVNSCFPAVMPKQSDPVMGAVAYSQASTKPEVGKRGTVAVHLQAERDDLAEADKMVEVIGQCAPKETIAILVRSRNHAQALLAALDRKKLQDSCFRYQAIDFTPLAETPVIRDLVSLTLALVQPANRLAWLATLRAPYIGLDLNDMDSLVAGDGAAILLDSLYAASLDESSNMLSDNAVARLKRAAPVLHQSIEKRGRISTRTLVESTWINLGGPACVDNPSELGDATTYFDLLDELEDQNLPITHDTLERRMGKLYAEPDTLATGNLQVLTIYSAKGLQFDTVLLPGLNRPPASDDPKLLHWFELAGQDAIVMSPMRNQSEKDKQKDSGDLITFVTEVEKQRKRLENGRLLYVAATRAIHSLHLFVSIKPNKANETKPANGSLMGNLWPAIEHQYRDQLLGIAELGSDSGDEAEGAITSDDAQSDARNDEGNDPGNEVYTDGLNLRMEYRRLAPDWQLPVTPAPVQQHAADELRALDYIEFNWAGENARLTGNLVHRLLQLIGESGLAGWQSSGGLTKRHNWCRAQLASEGVKGDKAAAIIKRASQAIENCLASVQGQWILEKHEDARCELAITAVLDDRPVNLVLDRTFIANGTRWIIDYKTSSHSGGDLEGFLNNEASRYAEQMQRYRKALALTETLPIKTALYFPLLDRLQEVG